jgi:4-hydroxy-4-methyl-2-oxoglutarate aldolase
MSDYGDLARIGTATIYEAAGRVGLVDLDLLRLVPDSCTAGPARPVLCAQGDIRTAHTALEQARPGDVLVLTMPEPEPLAMFGDLMAAHALTRDVAAVLVDGAVRDADELAELELPVWARWVRVRSGPAECDGTLDEPITVGGVTISAGDIVVLDGDGAVVIAAERLDEVRAAAHAWDARERAERAKLLAELSLP